MRWDPKAKQGAKKAVHRCANIGDGFAIFEATHGTAPKYADKDVIDPGSVMLSGVMLFSGVAGDGAADRVVDGEDDSAEVCDV